MSEHGLARCSGRRRARSYISVTSSSAVPLGTLYIRESFPQCPTQKQFELSISHSSKMASLTWSAVQPGHDNYLLPALLVCLVLFALYRVIDCCATISHRANVPPSGLFRQIFRISKASQRSRAQRLSLATCSNWAKIMPACVRSGSNSTAIRSSK